MTTAANQSYSVAAVFVASGGATQDDTAVADAIAKHGMKIILGSKSFTRKAILTEMGVEYDVVTADIDEKAIRKETPEELVMALAMAKADAIVARLDKDEDGAVVGLYRLNP
jgi:septum formation protein